MEYVRLGNAGVKVSKLSLGCMDFPTRTEPAEAQRIVDTAIDHGVNLFDTADAYFRGAAEEALGKLIRGKRDGILLATKFWAPVGQGPNDRGCSRLHLLQTLEGSLKRLGTDHVDLLQLHHPSNNTPVEEALSTLDTLVKQGKVRYVGVCNHYAWQMAHLLGVCALHNWEPLVSLQCRYNLLDRAIENETVHFLNRFGVATLVYGPLDGGMLAGVYRRGERPPEGSRYARVPGYYEKRFNDEVFDTLEAIESVAQRLGMTMGQLAVRWLLGKPHVTTVLLGGSRAAHFEPMYDAPEKNLPEAVVEELDRLTEPFLHKGFWNQSFVSGAPEGLNWW